MKEDASWTLFLDRDGVINERLPGAYIKDWDDFQFTSGTLEAFARFNQIFSRVFIVTNQQGIGKGLMTQADVNVLHQKLEAAIITHGGRIDGIYTCPDLATQPDNCRKPNPALALQAQADFPEVDFKKSVMVGDSISDIQFGQQLRMRTVLIDTKEDEREQWAAAKVAGLEPHLTLPNLASLTAHIPAFLS